MEHKGPDDNAEVFVHDGDTFRAAALIQRPLASSRYGAEGLMLVLDEDGTEAEDLGCRRDLALGLSLIRSEGRGEDYELSTWTCSSVVRLKDSKALRLYDL